MKQWYVELFENYAETYDKEAYTQGTMGEVDFIEREINFDKTRRILDIGCGTGRHAIELARRGYRVTGIDLSARQIARAREKSAALGVDVEFVVSDAREIGFSDIFDLAIMICEGAFPLMETDEQNFKILANAAKALRKEGKFILTTLCALFPLYHSVKDFINANSYELQSEGHRFDLLTFRDRSTVHFTDDAGSRRTIHCDERYYAPAEINWYLKSLGFRTVNISGCRTGHFSRAMPLTPDDLEMLVIAEKNTGQYVGNQLTKFF